MPRASTVTRVTLLTTDMYTLQSGPQHIVVTLGERGALWLHNTSSSSDSSSSSGSSNDVQVKHFPAPAVEAQDSTGTFND
jgi:sugar/nucleoside kinase (ribokinase family)